MAWLGNGLSQITGQISNFTKEVLTEGTEELDDHATKLRVAHARMAELEAHCLACKSEVDRVKGENDDLSEKLESAELQIKAISDQYRSQLDERECEIKTLKQTQNELLEQQGKLPSTSSPPALSLSHSASMPSFAGFSVGEEDDFGDVISSQHEINRLRAEVQRLSAECHRWQRVAESAQVASKSTEPDQEGGLEDSAFLHAQIKELQQQLQDEIDQHQHELSALQDVHAQKLATLKKKHKDEIQQLQNQRQEETESGSDLNSEFVKMQEENSLLKSKLESTSAIKTKLEKQLATMKLEQERLKAEVSSSQKQLENGHLKNTGLSHEDSLAGSEMQQAFIDGSLPSSTPKPTEKGGQSIISASEEVNILRKRVAGLECEVEQFDLQRSDWLMEKEALEEVLVKLRQQVQDVVKEQKVPEHSEGLSEIQIDNQKLKEREGELLAELEKEREKNNQLENAIKTSVASDKENIQKQFSTKLLEKDSVIKVKSDQINELQIMLNEKLTGDSSFQQMEETVKALQSELNEVTTEKNTLLSSLEELDEQHQVALQQMIRNRDQLLEKNKELEKENRQLSEEKDQEVSSLKDKVETLSKENQQFLSELKEKETHFDVTFNEFQKGKDDMEEKLKKVSQSYNDLDSVNKSLTQKNSELEQQCEEFKSIINSSTRQLQEIQNTFFEAYDVKSKSSIELKEKKQECIDVNAALSNMTQEIDNLQNVLTTVNIEKYELSAKLKEAHRQLDSKEEEFQQSFNSEVTKLNAQIESLSSQNKSLERELTQIEQKLQDQEKHYDSYITELKNSKHMDTSALQEEHEKLLKVCHEKDMKISDYEIKCNDLELDLDNINKRLHTAIDNQKQSEHLVEEKENEITSLRSQTAVLEQSCSESKSVIQKYESELERLKKVESECKEISEENSRTKVELDTLRSRLKQSAEESTEMDSKALEVITELETEIEFLNKKLVESQSQVRGYEQEIPRLKNIIQEQETNLLHSTGLIETGESEEGQDTVIKNLQQTIAHREQELVTVSNKLEKAKALLNEDQLSFIDDPNSKLTDKVIRMQNECLQRIPNLVGNCEGLVNGEITVTQEDIMKLHKIISEKEEKIVELKTKNSSLARKVEEAYAPGEQFQGQMKKLEEDIQSLRKEREQIMSVLNEKSRECSNLKSETHRLMNVISAEKSAISKLQQDNQDLMKSQREEEPNSDMTRDAVKNLSRIVRDKDLEIEALHQKNQTLLQVLQESSTAGSQVATLMAERDNMAKQLTVWQNDREQIIAVLNQKHQESLAFHTEVQRVSAMCKERSEELDQLKHQQEKLRQQYEDKQQQLLKTQNEVVNYKHKFQELESRYQEIVKQNEEGAPQSILQESTKQVEELNSHVHSLKQKNCQMELTLTEKTEMLRTNDLVIAEKDKMLTDLTSKCHRLEEAVFKKDSELGTLKKQAENMQFQMSGVRTEVGDLQQERNELLQQNRALQSEVNILKDSHQKLNMYLGEKDFEINALKEKANNLAKLVAEKGGDEKGEMDRMMRESEAMQAQAQAFQQERDQALLALQHSQAEVAQLRDQLNKLAERERKLGRELERLRNHLLVIEENYTTEALQAEEREKDLRTRLASAEERASTSSFAVKNASEQANAQLESLQRQLHSLAEQRDTAVLQLASAHETANQYATSLNNLQMVLEQFQRERDTQVAVELERYQRALEQSKTDNGALHEKCHILTAQLEESQEAIEAAHRLSEQLDRKEEAMEALKEEVLLREKQLKRVEEELQKISSSSEAKVDKIIIKNLFLGYFHTPVNKRQEVLQLIGKVLEFSDGEMQQAGAESSQNKGWLSFGGLLRRSPPHPTTPPTTPHKGGLDKSFSELFVKFLEKESTPTPQMNLKLPAEAMAREQQVKQQHHQRHQHQKPAFNPFSAPRHATMPIQVGGVQPDESHLLMKPMASTLPTFTPLIRPELTIPAAQPQDGVRRDSVSSSGRSTPATTSAFLRDVLQQ